MQTLKLSQQRQQKNALGMLTLGSLVFQGVNTLLLLGLLGAFIGLKDKAPPAMVQLEAGKTIAVEPMDSRQRTPAVIQKFVKDQLTLLMSASGQMPRTVGEDSVLVADPGIEVSIDGGRAKITTLARLAAFGISEDFRSAFLRDLAERTPQDVFSANGERQRVLIVQDVSAPEPVAEGQWKVTVISSLVDFETGDPVGVPKPFNKEVFVQSVPVPAIYDFSSPLEKQIAEIRQSGLEIYAIRNYVRRNIQSPSRAEVEPDTETFIDTRPQQN
ncbi:MAG: hypothetical protein D6694_09090 [Gammaproteobacteria bacterium]|nr:MAG: hypothetical protein D6694_09090 [Gammaproteobacteria bacterium]